MQNTVTDEDDSGESGDIRIGGATALPNRI